jgi:GrpB-like predicted nucleotidyltransferase (UPF0157 family)
MSARIRIVEADPGWPDLFQREAHRIRSALADLALRVEHVGSTSVPALAAKPVLDILLVVADSAQEDGYAPALDRAGYKLVVREPNWHEHRLFRGPDRDINLHVFSDGCPEIVRMLVFRDWLRSNESDRALYERAKRDLAQQEWKDVQNYADAKTGVIETILAKALRSRRVPEH